MVIVTGRETHRLCKKRGIKRISDSTVPALNKILAEFCDILLADAITSMRCVVKRGRIRQTIRGSDIDRAGKLLIHALKEHKGWLPEVDLTPIPIPNE